MKLWTWEHGRQGHGYSKFLIARSTWLRFDLYFLRLPKTSMVPHHKDFVSDAVEHHRVNIVLRKAKRGGETYILNPNAINHTNEHGVFPLRLYEEAPRVYRFRPDQQMHFVTSVMKGEVWLLSFGWVRNAK